MRNCNSVFLKHVTFEFIKNKSFPLILNESEKYCLFLQISSQLELWSEELQNANIAKDMNEAEHALHIHNESVSNMQQTALDVIQRGQELYQVITFYT